MRREQMDFNSVNQDFSGERVVRDSCETVEHFPDSFVRIWRNDLSDGFPVHWHTDLEIIEPVENGYEAVVDGKAFSLRPGEILIIPSGALHSLTAPASGMRFIYLFDLASFSSIRGFVDAATLLCAPIHLTKRAFLQLYDEVRQTLCQMRLEYFHADPFYHLVIASLLTQLLATLGRDHFRNVSALGTGRVYKQQEYKTKFNHVLAYIDEHFTEEIRLDAIAASIGFSKYHFSRLFKQYTGYTLGEYICRRRIVAAEQLLERPDLSVTEVAMRSGFPSISTFNRIFRQYKNCSPSQYRSVNNERLRING